MPSLANFSDSSLLRMLCRVADFNLVYMCAIGRCCLLDEWAQLGLLVTGRGERERNRKSKEADRDTQGRASGVISQRHLHPVVYSSLWARLCCMRKEQKTRGKGQRRGRILSDTQGVWRGERHTPSHADSLGIHESTRTHREREREMCAGIEYTSQSTSHCDSADVAE